jgi:hypothetical protein
MTDNFRKNPLSTIMEAMAKSKGYEVEDAIASLRKELDEDWAVLSKIVRENPIGALQDLMGLWDQLDKLDKKHDEGDDTRPEQVQRIHMHMAKVALMEAVLRAGQDAVKDKKERGGKAAVEELMDKATEVGTKMESKHLSGMGRISDLLSNKETPDDD